MRKILFIAGTHGNEEYAIEVMRRIETDYAPDTYGYDWIIGNPRAVEKGLRFTEKDLNRSAPGNLNSEYYEERRAAEIIQLSAEYELVIDLHGTDADCGLVNIIPHPTRRNIELAEAVPLSRNVVWYSDLSQTAGPLVQHTHCPGVEIECGPKGSDRIANELRWIIENILKANANGRFTVAKPIKQSFYMVYGSIKGSLDESLHDFQLATHDDESFFPFLSRNQYTDKTCYKMRKTNSDEIEFTDELP
jgi:hypothetical protein